MFFDNEEYVDDSKEVMPEAEKSEPMPLSEEENELQKLNSLNLNKDALDAIHKIFSIIKINKARRDAGLPCPQMSLKYVFLGDDSIKQIEVAKVFAKFLNAYGLIEENKILIAGKDDLLARFVGQTASKTNKVIEAAKGGVLFIKEAQNLIPPQGQLFSFEMEAIDTLIRGMEEYRNNLSVIFAGSSKPLQEFIKGNAGLEARLKNIIDFEN